MEDKKAPAKRKSSVKTAKISSQASTAVSADTTEKPVKMRGRGGKYNFPSSVPPEDKAKVRTALSTVLKWREVGKDRARTPEDFMQRTDEFFQECYEKGERPTWEKYCLALGHDISDIWDYSKGKLYRGANISQIIRYAKSTIASYDTEMVSSGNMNTVAWIFRAKNYYGMSDQQEIVVTPSQPLGAEMTAEEIAEKYKSLPE